MRLSVIKQLFLLVFLLITSSTVLANLEVGDKAPNFILNDQNNEEEVINRNTKMNSCLVTDSRMRK